jgi:lipoyl(octanoyl) transferase
MNAHALAEPGTVEWKYSDLPVDYASAIAFMEDRVAAIRGGTETECVWLLEHPPLYTAGATAKPEDLLEPGRFPVHSTGRGGQYTYHGPGQRVAYVMLDLDRRGADVRHYVRNLETWLIAALARFGIKGETHSDRIGIWVAMPEGDEAKIAAIGVRIRRWVPIMGSRSTWRPTSSIFPASCRAESRVTA